MRLALITAVYGDYDPIRDLPADHGFDDAICVTDGMGRVGDGWRSIIEPSDLSPRLAAKRPKMMPWLYTDCDAAVWLDASFEVIAGSGAATWARGHLARNDFVVWIHPEGRSCIQQEAEVCWFFDKYKDYPIREQVASYMADGMPSLWGLFACGTVGWRFTDEAKALGEARFAEQERWSVQDQLSLPYLLWDSGKPFAIWQANEYDNPYFKLRWDERPRPTE